MTAKRGYRVGATLQVGQLTLNLDRREVIVGGRAAQLSAKEYEVLELLVRRRGVAVNRETLAVHLYGDGDMPKLKIIDVFICTLRKKLAGAGADNLIGTVWGRGYMVREVVMSTLSVGTQRSGLDVPSIGAA